MIRKVSTGAVMLLVGLIAACNTTETTAPVPKMNAATLSSSMALSKGGTCVLANNTIATTGFDMLGYNRCAGLFNGPADGVDGVLDGKLWGINPGYANDHLVMKWNAAWDVCNANHSPVNCAGAWINNEWNGKVPGGSGERWVYKIKWVGLCGAEGTPTPDGGSCIWGEYEVVFSQGTVGNQHFWEIHAKPTGYGN